MPPRRSLPLIVKSPVRIERSNRVVSAPITNSAALEHKREGMFRLWKPRKHEKILIVLFLLTLPLSNPWVRGDGVGYYAYARAMLIEHRLDFQNDWKHGNESFALSNLDARLRAQMGSEFRALQKRLGHASVEATRLYTRVSDASVVAEYRRALGLGQADAP